MILENKNKLISDIEPIGNVGINLLEADKADQKIDSIIEEPLRKACKLFRKKGIETVMSSANKNNLTKADQKPKEKEDVDGKWMFYPSPTFEDAGVGYAWVMINFTTLSDDNKDILFKLEASVGPNGEKRGEKVIWFVHPFPIGNIDYKLKTGQISYEDVKLYLSEDEKWIEKIEKDERLTRFEEKSIILSYNNRYPVNVVIIRMPINGETTVGEVEEYFVKFAEILRQQEIAKEREIY